MGSYYQTKTNYKDGYSGQMTFLVLLFEKFQTHANLCFFAYGKTLSKNRDIFFIFFFYWRDNSMNHSKFYFTVRTVYLVVKEIVQKQLCFHFLKLYA
jgi:hypothetical protein